MWNPITGKSNSILSYAKWLGDIGYKVAGVDNIKNVYHQTYSIANHLVRDEDGNFIFRKGAYENLVSRYKNAPEVNGRVNFINAMFKGGYRDKDIDKSYSVSKLSAQVSFVLVLCFITFSALDLISSQHHILRAAGLSTAAFMMLCFFVTNSLSTYQFRNYNLCTLKQYLNTPQWWAEAFKIKVAFDPLKIVMVPKLLKYSAEQSANQQKIGV